MAIPASRVEVDIFRPNGSRFITLGETPTGNRQFLQSYLYYAQSPYTTQEIHFDARGNQIAPEDIHPATVLDHQALAKWA